MTIPAEDIIPTIAAGTAAGRRPTLTLDVALYESYLDGSGLAEEERRALLEDLWAIIVGFVELGFAVEPAAQQVERSDSDAENLTADSADLVRSSPVLPKDQFTKSARPSSDAAGKAKER